MVTVIERDMKVFRNGRSRAVRLPDEFGLDGDTLTLRKGADGVVTIESQRTKPGIASLLQEFAADPLDPADAAVLKGLDGCMDEDWNFDSDRSWDLLEPQG